MKKRSFLAATILSLVWQGQARADSFGQSSIDAGIRPFYEQSADPSVSSNLGMLYSKDASGITQLFYKTDDGTVYQITPLGAGTGDVVGPASATDNCFPRFNTTTGKLIQNSGVCADDSNNVTGAASVTATTFTGALTGNADTATALASNPSDCSANQFATTIAASGNLTCAGLADADVPDDITLTSTKAISTTLTNGAGASANPLDITSTLGIFDGSDDYTAIDINLTNANHTGATNTVQGIDISGITADAQATETAINIGNGWDTGINAGNSNIVTTGKIGIGTASPSSALHITSNSASSNIVEVAPATAVASDVYFKANGASTAVTGSAFILAGDTNTSSISTIKNTQRGAGDPVTQYTIFGGADWTEGIDNSDSDKFKISASNGLGASDVLSFTTAGVADFATALADSEVSDTLTSSIFVGSGSSTNAVDLGTAEVAGTTAITNGGTGQTTAAAAFDALSPNTTRGDVTVRGASSNQRLALGGKGRSLVSDGTDTVYDYTAIYDLNQFGTFNASGANFGGGGILNNTVASGTSSATNNTAGAAVNFATAATTGSDAGIVSFASIRLLDNKYVALIKFQLQTTATVRAFVGFCDSATIANCMGADDPTQRMAGLQFSTNRGDANFQFVTDDNTTQTVTNTSTAVDTNVHFLKIDASSGTSIIYTLYDSSGTQQATSTQSTNLPTATTAFSLYIANETLANSAASIRSYNGRLQSKLL